MNEATTSGWLDTTVTDDAKDGATMGVSWNGPRRRRKNRTWEI